MSDIYLSITETPAVVTLSQPVISSSVAATVTVGNTVTVALDTNSLSALENVTVTVGAAVSVSNFPASQVVTGSVAVTTMPALSISSVTVSNLGLVPSSVATDGTADGTLNFVKIGGHQSGSNQTAHIVHVSAGGSMSVDATDSVVSISNFPSTQTIAGTVTANSILVLEQPVYEHTGSGADRCILIGTANADGGQVLHTSPDNPMPISGSISGTVTVGNFPPIEDILNASRVGMLAQNLSDTPSIYGVQVAFEGNDGNANAVTSGNPFPISGTVTVGNSVTIGSLPAISGTVTANVANVVTINSSGASFSQRVVSKSALQFTAIAGAIDTSKFSGDYTVLPVKITSETDGLNLAVDLRKTSQGNDLSAISNDSTAAFVRTQVVGGSVTIGSLPSGALTTRFGSVATANLAFITSAVTNASRKYLLAQNISAGTVTIGIGFSPTTTQGIQLTAGAGLTFDSFCPTGAVFWLGAVTGAAFTILEG